MSVTFAEEATVTTFKEFLKCVIVFLFKCHARFLLAAALILC